MSFSTPVPPSLRVVHLSKQSNSSITLEERFEALMKQNELLASKIREGSQKNQEIQAQNEYLGKQLGSILTQNRSWMKTPFNLNKENVSKSLAMRLNPQVKKNQSEWLGERHGFKQTPAISGWRFLNLKVSLILRVPLLVTYSWKSLWIWRHS